MNELFIYELFKNVLQKSKVIEGRFAVAEGFGNDLNANNLDNIITDVLGGITNAKKYPIAILLPPYEFVKDYDIGWSTFRFKLYFLCTTYHNGDNSIKTPLAGSNVSNHPIKYDWKDMREVAGNFRKQLNEVTRNPDVLKYIREKQDAEDYYERVSLMSNDKLSGVCVQFDMQLFMPCELADYDECIKIQIPDLNIHKLHKH